MDLTSGHSFICPYCGSPNFTFIEADSPDVSWTQDCEICCRPIAIRLSKDTDGPLELDVRPENG